MRDASAADVVMWHLLVAFVSELMKEDKRYAAIERYVRLFSSHVAAIIMQQGALIHNGRRRSGPDKNLGRVGAPNILDHWLIQISLLRGSLQSIFYIHSEILLTQNDNMQ